MADIDKSLPNVKTSIEVNPQEEIEIEQEKAVEAQDPGVDVTPLEDGSVEVNFDPSKVNKEGQPGHFDNSRIITRRSFKTNWTRTSWQLQRI